MALDGLSVDQISRVHHVMITVSEMATDRGYLVAEEWCPKRLDEFRSRFVPTGAAIEREKMMLYCRHEKSNEGLFVFFNGDASVNTQKVKEYAQHARNEGAKTIILVTEGKLNPPTKKYVETLARSDVQPITMQVFHEDDLVVNITKHELVPQHVPLSDAEAKEVLDAFALKMSMLPRILQRDPIAQDFGMRKGQMFRIMRKSETAGEYTTYRQVV